MSTLINQASNNLISNSHLTNSYMIFLLIILSAVIGSFINVVIHRLPRMIERQLQQTIDHASGQASTDNDLPTYNLAFPFSHCPNCQQRLKIWHNIPLISYLLLRGRCHFCHHHIAYRYFLVEFLSALLALILWLKFSWSITLIMMLIFSWLGLSIIFIDFEHFIIPDSLNYSLLWLGLLFSTSSHSLTSASDAIIGAMTAYILLFGIATLFQWLTKKQGMGAGDFKLLAAVASWTGWQCLLFNIFTSSVLALCYVMILLALKKPYRVIPFGPFIIIASWLVLYYHQPLLKFLQYYQFS